MICFWLHFIHTWQYWIHVNVIFMMGITNSYNAEHIWCYWTNISIISAMCITNGITRLAVFYMPRPGQTSSIELVILSSLGLSLVIETITLETNESWWRTSGLIYELWNWTFVWSLICWLSGLSQICHVVMITKITIRILMHILFRFLLRQFIIITNWIMITLTWDIMFNWNFFLNSTNLWLWNNGNIRNHYVCQCLTVPEIQWNGCCHSWTHAHFAVALAVSHNITMGREGSPTIQTGPFYLASHEWECHEDKWNRQGEFSCFSYFERVEVWEADHMTWGCTKNRKNIPAFRPSGRLNEIWIYIKLIRNKNWHVVPSWWSIIQPQNNQSNIFEWYTLDEIKKSIIVVWSTLKLHWCLITARASAVSLWIKNDCRFILITVDMDFRLLEVVTGNALGC